MEECMDYFKQGLIGPVGPKIQFDAIDMEAAFRFMQKGAHIGKIVIKMPDDTSILKVANIKNNMALRSDATYLMVGGLGGLGKAISTWMVERGAKSLLYLSRSAGKTEEDQLFFRELAAAGCVVTAFAGSVNAKADVEAAVASAPTKVAGILQMSMVLRVSHLHLYTFIFFTLTIHRMDHFRRCLSKTGRQPSRQRYKVPGTYTKPPQVSTWTSSSCSLPLQDWSGKEDKLTTPLQTPSSTPSSNTDMPTASAPLSWISVQ
jgi:hypothetical protein